MKFIRGLGRVVLMLLIMLSITGWVSAIVVQQTVANRQTVIRWLDASNVYKSVLPSLLPEQEKGSGDANQVDPAIVQTVITQTFSASYIQQQTKVAVNAAYDWLEKKTETLHFTVHLEEKRPEFIANLATALEPSITALPQCSRSLAANCRPQNVSVKDFANTTATNLIKSNEDFLSKPFEVTVTNSQQPQFALVREILPVIPPLVIGLPIFVALAATAYAFLSDKRLSGLAGIGKRMLIAGLPGFILGLAGLFASNAGNFAPDPSGGAQQAMLINSVVNPILHQIIFSVALWVSIASGAVVAAGGITWLVAWLIQRKHQEPPVAPAQPVADLPAPTPPPTISTPEK